MMRTEGCLDLMKPITQTTHKQKSEISDSGILFHLILTQHKKEILLHRRNLQANLSFPRRRLYAHLRG